MNVKDMVLIGLLSAIVTAGKLALSFVPNVEIVTLLFIVYTISLGTKRSVLISVIFVTTEILIYGLSTWLLVYYFIWIMLIVVTTMIGKKFKSEYMYATIAGIFGITFGVFFAITESFFYGWAYGVTYWIHGIPWDILHGASNFIVTLVLFKPLSKVLTSHATRFKKSVH